MNNLIVGGKVYIEEFIPGKGLCLVPNKFNDVNVQPGTKIKGLHKTWDDGQSVIYMVVRLGEKQWALIILEDNYSVPRIGLTHRFEENDYGPIFTKEELIQYLNSDPLEFNFEIV